MATVSTIVKNQAVILIGNFASRLLDFGIIVFLARKLGVDGFGQYSFIYVYYSIWAMFAELGFSTILTREFAQSPGTIRPLLGRALLTGGALGLVIIPLSLGGLWLFDYPPETLRLAGIACFMVFFSSRFLSFRKIFSALFQADYAPHIAILFEILERVVFLLLLLLLPRISLGGALLCLVASSAAGFTGEALTAARRFGRPTLGRVDRPVQPLLRASLLTFTGALFFLLTFKVDVIMLSLLLSDTAVGIYHAASRIPEALGMVSTAVAAPFFPLFSHTMAHQPERFQTVYRISIRFASLVAMFMIMLLLPVIETLVPLLLGAQYAASGPLAWWLLLGQVFIMVMMTFNAVLIAGNLTGWYVVIMGLAALVNIVLNLLLIPMFNIWGAVMATLTAYGLYIPLGLIFRPLRVYTVAVVQNIVRTFAAAAVGLACTAMIGLPHILAAGVSVLIFSFLYIASGGIKTSDLALIEKLYPVLASHQRLIYWLTIPERILRNLLHR